MDVNVGSNSENARPKRAGRRAGNSSDKGAENIESTAIISTIAITNLRKEVILTSQFVLPS
jgi:hypothetical protein